MNEREKVEKKAEILDLLFKISDFELERFFDVDSDKMLDDKIEVLKALKEGKHIEDIPKFYDVLELMPKNDKWD